MGGGGKGLIREGWVVEERGEIGDGGGGVN